MARVRQEDVPWILETSEEQQVGDGNVREGKRNKKVKGPQARLWYLTKATVAFLVGLPFAAAGLVACATIIGWPLGMLLFAVSGYPLQRVVKTNIERTGSNDGTIDSL